MIVGDAPLKAEAVKQRLLHHPPLAHHRPNLLRPGEGKAKPHWQVHGGRPRAIVAVRSIRPGRRRVVLIAREEKGNPLSSSYLACFFLAGPFAWRPPSICFIAVTLPPIESKSAMSWLQSNPLGAFPMALVSESWLTTV